MWLRLRREDLIEPCGRIRDALETRIPQAAVIVDVHCAVSVTRLDDQLDRRTTPLRGGDRALDRIGRVGDAVDRGHL